MRVRELRGRNTDPTAGVTLVHPGRICPRCGIKKPGGTTARRGLCHDCSTALKPEERRAWL